MNCEVGVDNEYLVPYFAVAFSKKGSEMKDQNVSEEHDGTKNEMNQTWEPPEILEYGVIEARLFSDEPDPWGGP